MILYHPYTPPRQITMKFLFSAKLALKGLILLSLFSNIKRNIHIWIDKMVDGRSMGDLVLAASVSWSEVRYEKNFNKINSFGTSSMDLNYNCWCWQSLQKNTEQICSSLCPADNLFLFCLLQRNYILVLALLREGSSDFYIFLYIYWVSQPVFIFIIYVYIFNISLKVSRLLGSLMVKWSYKVQSSFIVGRNFLFTFLNIQSLQQLRTRQEYEWYL